MLLEPGEFQSAPSRERDTSGFGSRQWKCGFLRIPHQSCELNGANPFDYLTALLRHPEAVKQRPSQWMPWNYRETLARLATPAAA